MSPVRRPARQLSILLSLTLVVSLALVVPAAAQDEADYSVPADAPAPAEGAIVRVLTVGVLDTGTCADGQAAPCWDVSTFSANPGDTVVLIADLRPSDAFHNAHLTLDEEPAPASEGPKSQLAGNAFHKVALQMPAEGSLSFICDAHPQTMVGQILTPAAAAALGGGHESIPTLGVHFLAYWVGIIAFAILFVVYGLTFFLFKYNETRAATDHWDRSEPAGGSKRLAAVAPLLAVGLGIAGIAAIVFVAMSR